MQLSEQQQEEMKNAPKVLIFEETVVSPHCFKEMIQLAIKFKAATLRNTKEP